MSQVQRFACDGCGKLAENPYGPAGWIRIEGSIIRAAGRYENGYVTHVRQNGDFCSGDCLVVALQRSSRVIRNDIPGGASVVAPPATPPTPPPKDPTPTETPTRGARLKDS